MSDEHKHDYLPTRSKTARRDGDTVTVVILHCACGSFDYNVLPGDWTMEELAIEPMNVKTDAETLKAMGIKCN